ncbi:MAG: hypothetical protein ACLSHG_00485 [Oscillospiraceae bacterium]
MARKNEPYIYKVLRRETPNPRQQAFFRAEAANIAYGGARGGGKQLAMRRKLVLLAMRYPGLKLLLLRRTLPELRANHILPLQRELAGYAAWSGAERAFRFPNGSRLVMGYCDSDSDCAQYQGQEYEVIGFEEATNFEPDWLTFIATLPAHDAHGLRPGASTTRATPAGRATPTSSACSSTARFTTAKTRRTMCSSRRRSTTTRCSCSATPAISAAGGAAARIRRRAHLEGDWNVYEGQVFAEWRDDPAHYADGKWTHVIEPFDIPNTWRVYRSFDFGYAKPFSVGWWAVDFDGRLYRILELYGCVPGEPDTGVCWTPEQIFEQIRTTEATHSLSARPGHPRRGRPRDLGRIARRQHRRHCRPVRRVLRAGRPQAPARLDASALSAGVRRCRAANAVCLPQLPGYAAHAAAAALRRTRARGRGHAAGGPHRRRDPVSVPVRPHRAAARGTTDAESVRPAEQRLVM